MVGVGADYQCVTHPFARYPTKVGPSDLHALDTPPAFILSQDQTLGKEILLILIIKDEKNLSKPKV